MHQILQDHVRFKNSQNNTSGIIKISYFYMCTIKKDTVTRKYLMFPKSHLIIRSNKLKQYSFVLWCGPLTSQKIISPTKRAYSIDPEYKISPIELSTTLIEFLPHKLKPTSFTSSNFTL